MHALFYNRSKKSGVRYMRKHVCTASKDRETNFNDEVKPYRDDRSPLKRAELHCHTKMSKLDGITDVREVLERAHDWGL